MRDGNLTAYFTRAVESDPRNKHHPHFATDSIGGSGVSHYIDWPRHELIVGYKKLLSKC